MEDDEFGKENELPTKKEMMIMVFLVALAVFLALAFLVTACSQ